MITLFDLILFFVYVLDVAMYIMQTYRLFYIISLSFVFNLACINRRKSVARYIHVYNMNIAV